MTKIPMTATGYTRLQDELKRLKTVDRPAVIRAIAEARENGDLSENAEYHAARERQSFIEGRVLELEDKIARAEVIDVSKLSGHQPAAPVGNLAACPCPDRQEHRRQRRSVHAARRPLLRSGQGRVSLNP